MLHDEENVKSFVEILYRYKLSASQYVFLSLIYHKRADLFKLYNKISHTESIDPLTGAEFPASTIRESEIRQLVARGILLDMNKEGEYFPELYSVSDKIEKELFTVHFIYAEEFWAAYPDTLTISKGGRPQTVPARTGDKEWFLFFYAGKIKSKKAHEEMMQTLDKFKRMVKSGKLSAVGLEKYLKNEVYLTVQRMEEKGGTAGETFDYSEDI